MERCGICDGAGIIRLPYRRQISLAELSQQTVPETAIQTDYNYRGYPCPECSEVAPQERIKIVRVGAERRIDERYRGEPEYEFHCRKHLASAMAYKLLEAGLLSYDVVKIDHYREAFQSTLGVVSTKHVATIEQRAATAAIPIAEEVYNRAVAQISNWGSYYGRAMIEKDKAKEFISVAVREAIENRAEIAKRCPAKDY